jgi:hypothetical protein
MASTCQDIATRALRKLGVLRAGAEPKAADAASALASLTSYYMECVTGGAFGRVVNIPLSTAGTVTAGGNQHINILVDDAVTVDLPSTLPVWHWVTWMPCRDYGWGLNVPLGGSDGNNVPPDKSVVMVTDKYTPATRATYVYDGTVQLWMRIDNLILTNEAPLSARNSDGLAALLAVRMADEFGDSALSPLTLQAANRYKLAMVTNYGSSECGGYSLGLM